MRTLFGYLDQERDNKVLRGLATCIRLMEDCFQTRIFIGVDIFRGIIHQSDE